MFAENELCRDKQRFISPTGSSVYGSKLCQQEFWRNPCSWGTGCKSSGPTRRRFLGNLSHKADGRLLAQLRSTWHKYCTLLNQELGEAEGDRQTSATSNNVWAQAYSRRVLPSQATPTPRQLGRGPNQRANQKQMNRSRGGGKGRPDLRMAAETGTE